MSDIVKVTDLGSSDTTLAPIYKNMSEEISETEMIGDGAPHLEETKAKVKVNESNYCFDSTQTITGELGSQEDGPTCSSSSLPSSEAIIESCELACFKWKTFSDEEYTDWKKMSKKNTEIPLRSFFSILKMNQCPKTVSDKPPKPSLLSLAEERLAKNLCATTCVWIGEHTHFDCIPGLLKCYSVWFATRDWRLQEFTFEEKNVPALGFEMLYKWMRTTEVPELKNVVPTLQAAKHLKVEILCDALWARMCHESVQEKIAFRCYLQAQNLPELGILRETMLGRVRNYFLPLVGSEDFIDLEVDVLEQLLLLDSLGVNSEMEVFFAVLRWVGHRSELVSERLPHLQRLMDCVRFPYMPMKFLVSLRNSTVHPDQKELCRKDPVLLAFNKDPKTMDRISDAVTFMGSRCQHDIKKFMEMCRRKFVQLVYPRKWQYHPKCSYHVRHEKSRFPHTHQFTATDFADYVESLQEEWSGDGPEDSGKSQMEDLDVDIIFTLKDEQRGGTSVV